MSNIEGYLQARAEFERVEGETRALAGLRRQRTPEPTRSHGIFKYH
jgi:hypothetical protein